MPSYNAMQARNNGLQPTLSGMHCIMLFLYFSCILFTKLSGFNQEVKSSIYNWPAMSYFLVVSIFLTIPINWIFINTRIRFEPRIKQFLIRFFVGRNCVEYSSERDYVTTKQLQENFLLLKINQSIHSCDNFLILTIIYFNN